MTSPLSAASYVNRRGNTVRILAVHDSVQVAVERDHVPADFLTERLADQVHRAAHHALGDDLTAHQLQIGVLEPRPDGTQYARLIRIYPRPRNRPVDTTAPPASTADPATTYRNRQNNTVTIHPRPDDDRLDVTVSHTPEPGAPPIRSRTLRQQVTAAARKALGERYSRHTGEIGGGTPQPDGRYRIYLTRSYPLSSPDR
ncbi:MULTISPECIES: hypothetical protein [Nocardia]|uniref:hypothetical protein n=1 Tax=Nocardia TaxID=1817 RepID=UPI0024556E97|nr:MULTISPECIES: hypothetical protein [Nocardia]